MLKKPKKSAEMLGERAISNKAITNISATKNFILQFQLHSASWPTASIKASAVIGKFDE